MKTKTIISSFTLLSLCAVLYAAPKQDNNFSQLQTEVAGIMFEQVSKPTLYDLFEAIKQNDLKTVKDLINKGADVNNRSADGSTPLIQAVKVKGINIEIVKLLIRKNNINICDKNGMDALKWALKQNADMEIIKFLVAKGADIKSVDGSNPTALWLSFQSKEEDLVLYLMEKGATISESEGRMAILVAVRKNWMKVVKVLVEERGISVNQRYEHSFNAPLDYAIVNGNMEMVEYLIEHGADVNYITNKNSPLVYAVYKNRVDIARLLLEKGAKLRWMYWDLSDIVPELWTDYLTLLMVAAEKGNKEMVELLIEYGADVNETLKHRPFTALGAAAWKGRVDVAELLIQKGANINYQELNTDHINAGFTPLMFGVVSNNIQMVELLIKNGANVNAKDKYGNITALKLARKNEKGEQIYKLLRQHGARK